jgi:hypothetical protein
MSRVCTLALAVVTVCGAASAVTTAQAPEKELVATLSAKQLSGGLVTGVAWDGGTLIIQVAAVEKGEAKAKYFAVPGPRMELKLLDGLPVSVEEYWKRKASLKSPTGLGTITPVNASKLPMYGVASQEKRFADAMDMGGAQVTHELRIGQLVIHRRRDTAPYDGEVWSWSPADVNRVAYVDEKGDLWIARADGAAPERLLSGHFTLPAWSEDGRVLAFAERKGDGGKWEISVVHLADRFRQ